MGRFGSFALALLIIGSCNANHPPISGYIDGQMDGYVYVTAPVQGALVFAYASDAKTGARGRQIAESAPTTADGHFHLDLATYEGPLELVARAGAGGAPTYVEPATGVMATWPAGTELRAMWASFSPNGYDFVFHAGDEGLAVIGPFSHLSANYAGARLLHGRDATFSDSLNHSYELFHAHTEVEFWDTIPVDLTSGGTRALDPTVQAAAELGGLSQLIADIDVELGTSGHTTLDLLDLLTRDIRGGHAPSDPDPSDKPIFDGFDANGALTVGTCTVPPPGTCPLNQLSSLSLRTDWMDSISNFLDLPADSGGHNVSGIEPGAIMDFLMRVESRQSELFEGMGTHSYDVTPPTVTLVQYKFFDEAAASVTVDDLPGTTHGVANYTIPVTSTIISFDGQSTPSFSKFASRYSASDDNLPTWQWEVSDNRSAAETIRLQVHLLLQDSANLTEVAAWQDVPVVSGAGFNRQLVISTAFAPAVGLRSGTYVLEYQAIDTAGNKSPLQSVSWIQSLLPPPLRQRAGQVCIPCGSNDPSCINYYDLGDTNRCPVLPATPGNDASIPITGNGLPNGELHLSNGYIDNPNDVAVRVRLSPLSHVSFWKGTVWAHPIVTDAGTPLPNCDVMHPPPCFDPSTAPTTEGLTNAISIVNSFNRLEVHVTMTGFPLLAPCPTCGTLEREIPPKTTVQVDLFDKPISFVFTQTPLEDIATEGNLHNVTGYLGPLWLECTLYRADFSCAQWVQHRAVQYITRLKVNMNISITLSAKADDDAEPFQMAVGTNTAMYYPTSQWNTNETGWPSF